MPAGFALKCGAAPTESREMSRFPCRRVADDDGISLVEVLVGIVIIGVTLAAVLSTFVASFAAIQGNEARVGATALSNQLLEDMTTLPWDRLGLYVGEVSSATFGTENLVLIPNQTPRNALVPRATESPSVDDPRYSVRRWITWVNDSGGQDYKRLTVEVTWDVRGRPQRFRSAALRAPQPDEALSLEVEFTRLRSSSIPNAAVGLRGTSLHTNTEAIIGEIQVSNPSAVVKVTYRDRNDDEREILVPGNTTTRLMPTIAALSREFRNGPVSFVVTAESAPGALRPETASNVAVVNFYQPVVVGVPVVSHVGGERPLCTPPTGGVSSNVIVTVDIDGITTTEAVLGDVRVNWTGSGSLGGLQMEAVSDSASGAIFTAELVGPFSDGPVTFTVTARRSNAPAPFVTGDVSRSVTITRLEAGTSC